MKNLVNDYIIRMFVGDSDYRPAMKRVSLGDDGKLYSTCGHTLARIDKGFCAIEYESIKGFPDAKTVINGHEEKERFTVDSSVFIPSMIKAGFYFRFDHEDCDKCWGEGEIECECCGNDSECDKCDGKGVVKGDVKVIDSNDKVEFLGKKYLITHFDLLFKAVALSGAKEIVVSHPKSSLGGTIFYVGDFEILMIPRDFG